MWYLLIFKYCKFSGGNRTITFISFHSLFRPTKDVKQWNKFSVLLLLIKFSKEKLWSGGIFWSLNPCLLQHHYPSCRNIFKKLFGKFIFLVIYTHYTNIYTRVYLSRFSNHFQCPIFQAFVWQMLFVFYKTTTTNFIIQNEYCKQPPFTAYDANNKWLCWYLSLKYLLLVLHVFHWVNKTLLNRNVSHIHTQAMPYHAKQNKTKWRKKNEIFCAWFLQILEMEITKTVLDLHKVCYM